MVSSMFVRHQGLAADQDLHRSMNHLWIRGIAIIFCNFVILCRWSRRGRGRICKRWRCGESICKPKFLYTNKQGERKYIRNTRKFRNGLCLFISCIANKSPYSHRMEFKFLEVELSCKIKFSQVFVSLHEIPFPPWSLVDKYANYSKNDRKFWAW